VTDVLTQPVILGRIVGLFGVRGWLKVYSYTEPREAVLDYKDWLLSRDGDWQRVELAEGKRHGKAVIARLEGIEDRDAAAELLGSDIAVDRDALPPNSARWPSSWRPAPTTCWSWTVRPSG
jgi:16S rRNA processing protein RimM